MIKAITYWSMRDGLAGTHPIDDALDTAKAAGFAGLELCIGTEGLFHIGSSQEDCQAIAAQIHTSGVTVETVAAGITWGMSPTSDDSAIRRQSIEAHAAALQRTAWIGAQAMLMVPGIVTSPIAPDQCVRYDVALQRCREAVKQLLDTAERVGVDLCLENVWNGLFLSPIEFAEFIDSFASDRLGIYYDVGNSLGYHQHPPHWIEQLGKRIKRVHIKDYAQPFDWTGGYTFCDLGAGQVPWAATIAALRQIGYNKTIVAEMLPWDPALLQRTSAAMDVILNM